jgi:hypothetical protein
MRSFSAYRAADRNDRISLARALHGRRAPQPEEDNGLRLPAMTARRGAATWGARVMRIIAAIRAEPVTSNRGIAFEADRRGILTLGGGRGHR